MRTVGEKVRSELLCITTVLVLLLSVSVRAENLYLESVQNVDASEKDVAEAKKQLEEHKEIELQNALSVSPFHSRIDTMPTTKQPFCQSCHQALPHRDNQRSRTFLNMHSRYIACETCHLKPEGVKFDYRWLAYNEPGAGQVIDTPQLVHITDKPLTTIVPKPGARIAPFYKGIPALIFKDHSYASEVSQQWKQLSLEDKALLMTELHTPIDKEGRNCQSCHKEKQELLDLESLGADGKQSYAIRNNVIARFFSYYKKDDERIRLNDLLR